MKPKSPSQGRTKKVWPRSLASLLGFAEDDATIAAQRAVLVPDLIGRLRPVLAELDGCLTPPRFLWPTEAVLKNLDKLVKDLCEALGRQTFLSRWSDYKFLAGRRPSLKLCKRVEALLRRVAEHTPTRPANRLVELAREQTLRGKQAARLLKLWPKLRTGEIKRENVKWAEEFNLIFRTPSAGTTRTGFGLGSDSSPLKHLHESSLAFCYARYLEFFWEDILWIEMHSKGAYRLLDWAQHLFPPWSLVRALRWPSLCIPSGHRPGGGRPSAYTKGTQRRLIDSFLNDPRFRVAARAAGVSRARCGTG